MSLFERRRAPAENGAPVRVHLGCGQTPIAGWVNVDVQALPGVDRVLDVRKGLPFVDVAAIYAEHFLEHLDLADGLACLAECRRVLGPTGILRISTPNLDWVLATHYRHGGWETEHDAIGDCIQMNRAFHGWGHRFLYNRQALVAALESAGFAEVTMHRYGESDVPELAALERHEKSGDTPDLPHVLIAQARGRRRQDLSRAFPKDLLEEYRVALEAK
jgi:predicted SAM-dependent methyltransferase